jgi:hypothetical protein
MPIMDGSLISGGGQFAPSPNAQIANVIDGGQLGFGPLLINLDANTPLVLPPLVLTVLHVPTFFTYIPSGPQIFKALFETHMTSMDGIDLTYTMENDGTPVGRDGQQMMVPTKQTRSQLTPTATWAEKIGNVVWNFGRTWMNAIRDPDTQASSMAGIIASGNALPPHVASMYTADILLTQYDMTYRPENIIDAIALTNFMPTDIGGTGYQLNIPDGPHRPDRTFSFTCVAQQNNNTINVAKSVATLNNLHRINFQDAFPLAESIESSIQGMGAEYLAANYMNNFNNNNGLV